MWHPTDGTMITLITLLSIVALTVGQTAYSSRPSSPPYTFTPDGLVPIQYISVGPDDEVTRSVDNACYTYIKIACSEDYYMTYLSVVYCDGTNRVFSFLSYSNCSGIYYVSPTCSFISNLFGSGPGQTDLFHRTFITDGCKDDSPLNIFTVLGLTPNYGALPLSYLSELVGLINQSGYGCGDYIGLPMRRPPQCILSQPCTVDSTNCNNRLYRPGETVSYTTPSRCSSCGRNNV